MRRARAAAAAAVLVVVAACSGGSGDDPPAASPGGPDRAAASSSTESTGTTAASPAPPTDAVAAAGEPPPGDVAPTAATEPEPPPPCTPTAGQPRHERLGISPGHTLISDDVATVERELDGMAAAGVCWIRVDIDWSRLQPAPDRFDWAATDRAVLGARARGMEVLALLAYTPAWARPAGTSDKHPPTDEATFAAFAEVAARRYGRAGVRAWEIWNEPNIEAFWQPRPDAETYVRLLRAAAGAIRGAIDDPLILTGGLSPASDDPGGRNVAPVTFLEAIYAAGAADDFDVVAMHPYSYPLDPADEVPLNHFATVTPQLRDVMVRAGDEDVEIWATEFGAPTGTSSQAVDPATQAEHLADALALWDGWGWTGPLMIYAWRDRGTDLDDREDNFGLLDHDFRPKPALDVLLSVTGGSPPP